MRHLLIVLLQKLGAAVAEDLAEALIDPQPGAVDSDIADADGGVLEVPRKRVSLSRSASSACLRSDISRLKPTHEVMRSRSSRTGRPRLRMVR